MSDTGHFVVTGIGGLPISAGPGGCVTVQVEESDDLLTWKDAGPPAWLGPGAFADLAYSEERGASVRLRVTSFDAGGRIASWYIRPRLGPDSGGRS